MTAELLPCPFCSRPVPADLSDTLYPNGTYRRHDVQGHFYHYVSMNQSKAGDEPCWAMNCTENMGGCGASISADNREEVIAKWNTRATQPQAPQGAVTEWIDVEDQEPPRNTVVLFACKPGCFADYMPQIQTGSTEWLHYGGKGRYTHWAHINPPAAPKTETPEGEKQ